GTEPGAVNYFIAANGGPQRIGTITINGQPLNITQAPNINNCVYTLDTPGVTIPWQGGSYSFHFHLTTDNGCPILSLSIYGRWLTVNQPANGTGPADINYSVAANNSGAQRVGEITVGGQHFIVTQPPNPASCVYLLDSPGVTIPEQ